MDKLRTRKLLAIFTNLPRIIRYAVHNSSSNDYFGLEDDSPDVTNVEISSNVNNIAKIRRMVDDHRLSKMPSTVEKTYETSYGTLRYDADNKIPSKIRHKLDTSREFSHQNTVPLSDDLPKSAGIALSDIKAHPTVTDKPEDLSYVDSLYFGDLHLKKPQVNQKGRVQSNENQSTALDFVKKLRLTKQNESNKVRTDSMPGNPVEKCDSKGFRILSSQVHDIKSEPSFVVAKMLRDSVLYNDNDIVGLYKPYGVSCQSGSGCTHCIPSYLPDLAKFVKGPDEAVDLHTVHRLDKETTGVLILAKNQIMAKQLHSLFAQKKITKTYWAILAGIPEHPEGTIDIPIAEGSVDGKNRMVLKPERTEETRLVVPKSWVKSHKAVTHYKVLATSGNACLVELRPETGIKHQLRVHLGFGLGCPVLGDHKYSHLTKLAPQRLPSDMLQKLGIRQSKVRHIAMHLHAKMVLIPEILPGRYISISAQLPRHFNKNLKRLKIDFP